MLYDAFFKHQRKPKMTGLGECESLSRPDARCSVLTTTPTASICPSKARVVFGCPTLPAWLGERGRPSLTHLPANCPGVLLPCCPDVLLPPNTRHPPGELYYEGKEYEAQLEHLKPGVLSDELREALGMDDNSPPPWLVNMQVGGPGRVCLLRCGGIAQQNRE